MANFLSPIFNGQAVDANGDPAVGYKIYTYEAGTSTPIATYTTEAGGVAQANPIILNARGATDDVIWLAEGTSYKFVLTDSNDAVIDTYDDISGINDTSIAGSEWIASGFTPTYISATSFSVPGDRTLNFQVGRRIRSTNTGGTTYSLITASSYNGGTQLTTVTVSNDSGVLDSGLSSVDLALLTPTNPSLPNSSASRIALGLGVGPDVASASTLVLTGLARVLRLTGIDPITAITMDRSGPYLLTADAAAVFNVAGLLVYTCTAGDSVLVWEDNNGGQHAQVFYKDLNSERAVLKQLPTVRQTVLSGPVDSNGLPSFGGSTGSATLTTSGTLVATSANGTSGDRIGSITNAAFTSPAGNGTGYMYLDINLDGTCTAGVSTSAPVYQPGGTYSTTSGQFTFNYQEMVGKVGNGSTADQTHRVYIGECPHTAGVWSGTIVWYGLMGRYVGPWVATLPSASTAFSQNHNIGTADVTGLLEAEVTTTEGNYAVGDRVSSLMFVDGGQLGVIVPSVTSKVVAAVSGGSGFRLQNKTTGAFFSLTAVNFKYRFRAQRNF